MSFLTRGIIRFWSGTGKSPSQLNRYPPPWPSPRPPRFRPTPPPKPTTLVGKIKSYIPSRRWLIFGGIIGTWISLAAYDRRERKAAVSRWCKKVEYLNRRSISTFDDVQSVSVWICAPPGDQLKWNKEVWRDYVKPIIIAAGFDYSLHLSTQQGLLRTTIRETMLKQRLRKESSTEEMESLLSRETEGGDVIVLGRNTFKEVVRGIHEGHLLPLDYVPPAPPEEPKKEGTEKEESKKEGEEKPPPPKHLVLPAIPQSQYPSLPDPPPSTPEYIFTYVPSLHILGIRHTPKRIYRFLTRRYVADEICEQVVACVLEQPKREWTDEDVQHGKNEEKYWPKTIKPDSEWREDIVIDSRIRPKLFWRRPESVEEIPDYREPMTEEKQLKVEELVPTEEEVARDQMLKTQVDATKNASSILTGPWSRK